MASIDFELPKRVNPRDKVHVLFVAVLIQMICYKEDAMLVLPEIHKDRSVHFPLTNDYWLFPPGANVGQPKKHWRLTGRYAGKEELNGVVKSLQPYFSQGEAK